MEAVASGIGAFFGGGFVGMLAKFFLERAIRQFDQLGKKVEEIDDEVIKLGVSVKNVQHTLDAIQNMLRLMTVEEERKYGNTH